MKNRTGIDFSKHVHRVEIFKSDDNNEIRIDHFQVGNSKQNYIKFTNTDENLIVTGDYGSWIFCRPFVPAPTNGVSDSYWLEKLKIGSSQEAGSYDNDATAKEIEELINGGLEEYGYEGKELESIKEWYIDLLTYTEDEYEYIYKAYRDYGRPSNIDNESIPFVKKLNPWIEIIFDAFDEICERLKEQEKNQK